jgi:hypothetical protein
MKASRLILIFLLINHVENFAQKASLNLKIEDLKGKILTYGMFDQNGVQNDGCEDCGGNIFFINNDEFIDDFSNKFLKGNYRITNNEVILIYKDVLIKNKEWPPLPNEFFKAKLDLNDIKKYLPEEEGIYPLEYLKSGVRFRLLNNQMKLFKRVTVRRDEELDKGRLDYFKNYYKIRLLEFYKLGLFEALEIPINSIFNSPVKSQRKVIK